MTDVTKLAERIRRNSSERENAIAEDKRRNGRRMEIDAAPEMAMTAFWCRKCRRDLTAPGRKSESGIFDVDSGKWEPTKKWAKRVGKCPKGHRCERRITDMAHDPYWRESELVRSQRAQMSRDLLQPGQPGFDAAYPEHRRKQLEAEDRKERETYAEKSQS